MSEENSDNLSELSQQHQLTGNKQTSSSPRNFQQANNWRAQASDRFRKRFEKAASKLQGTSEFARSKSTSALNKLDDEDDEDVDDDEFVCEYGEADSTDDKTHLIEYEKDNDCENDQHDEEFNDDNATNDEHVGGKKRPTSSASQVSSGRAAKNLLTGASASASRLASDDTASRNLMSELKSFDKSKLARNKTATTTVTTKLDAHQLLLAATKRDLIAELKESRDLDGIKRMRDCHKGKEVMKQAIAAAMPVFKPEDFLDKVGEPELPLWRRQMLAKRAAERARREHADKLRVELEEKRLSQVPAWRRQMLAKKAAERNKRVKEEGAGTTTADGVLRVRGDGSGDGVDSADSQQRRASEMPTWRKQLARLKRTTSTGSISTLGKPPAICNKLQPAA